MRLALVVERDESVRRLLAAVLGREGFETDLAEDGQAAIDCLASGRSYSLMVLDQLPSSESADFMDFLRGHLPQAVRHIIFLSGWARAQELGLPEELCRVLQKPFDLDLFVEAVRRCSE